MIFGDNGRVRVVTYQGRGVRCKSPCWRGIHWWGCSVLRCRQSSHHRHIHPGKCGRDLNHGLLVHPRRPDKIIEYRGVDTKPMANLVGSGKSKVVVGCGASGDAAEKDGATIAEECVGIAGNREIAVSEKTTSETLDIDIESLVVTLAESPLHAKLIGVVEPIGVGGAGRSKKVERDTSRSEAFIHDIKLFISQKVRKVEPLSWGTGCHMPEL